MRQDKVLGAGCACMGAIAVLLAIAGLMAARRARSGFRRQVLTGAAARYEMRLGSQSQEPAALPAPDPPPAVTMQQLHFGALGVTVWTPSGAGKLPLVIFSHGFHGDSEQSVALMKAIAGHGYLVAAPNHADALVPGHPSAGFTPPVKSFLSPEIWNDKTYRDRADDILSLVNDLKNDAAWSDRIDWSRVALAGHSLGGYTVLGLAGGWKSWKMPGIKAVLALSPFCTPFTVKKTLGNISVPVMYQGGTYDIGITPFVKARGGAYDQTPSPSTYVEFRGAGHLAWTDLNPEFQSDIAHYCIAFLDRYLNGKSNSDLTSKTSKVSQLLSK